MKGKSKRYRWNESINRVLQDYSQKEEKYCFTHLRRSPCEVFETRFARQDPHRSKILTPPLWPKFTIFCPKIVITFSVRNQSNMFHRPISKDVFRMEFVQLVFVFKVFALSEADTCWFRRQKCTIIFGQNLKILAIVTPKKVQCTPHY